MHSRKWTALLTAALTKPRLNSSSYKLCIYDHDLQIPVSSQLQLRTRFLLPERVRFTETGDGSFDRCTEYSIVRDRSRDNSDRMLMEVENTHTGIKVNQ